MNSIGDVIVQKRAPNKESYPNMWDISSAAGDQPVDSAIREVEEELGLKVQEEELQYLFTEKCDVTINEGKYINKEHMHIYLLKRDLDLKSLTLQESEVSQVQWISVTKLFEAWKNGDPSMVPCDVESVYAKKLWQVLKPKST